MIYNSPRKSCVHQSLRGATMEQGIALALALPVENLIYWLGSWRLFKKKFPDGSNALLVLRNTALELGLPLHPCLFLLAQIYHHLPVNLQNYP